MASARQLLLTMGWFALCHSVTAGELNDEPAVEGATPSTTTVLYTYDALGRLIYVANPVAGDRDYRYDDAGNRTSVATDGSPHNRAPTANSDSVTLLLDETVSIDLVQNDSDPDGDMLTIASWTQPSNATVTPEGDGRRVSIHGTSIAANRSFTYTIADGFGGYASGTVSVTVNDPTPPVPQPIQTYVVRDANIPIWVRWTCACGEGIEYKLHVSSSTFPPSVTSLGMHSVTAQQWQHPPQGPLTTRYVWIRACPVGASSGETCSDWSAMVTLFWQQNNAPSGEGEK